MKRTDELAMLYDMLKVLCLKPQFGGTQRSTPEKRRAVLKRIEEIEGE
jgi:hypothetical protein